MKINNRTQITFKSNNDQSEKAISIEKKEMTPRQTIDMRSLTERYRNEYQHTLEKASKYYDLYKKSELAKNTSKTFEQVVPACDAVIKTALTEGTVAAKMVSGSTSYIDNFIIINANKLYDKALDKVDNKTDFIKNYSEKHPSSAFAINILSGLAVTKLVMMEYDKLKNYAEKKFPEINTYKKKATKFFNNNVPGTKFIDNNILKPIPKWVRKNPITTKAIAVLIDAFLVGTVIKNIYDINKLKQNNAEHYDEAKNVRYEAARGALGQLFYWKFVDDFLKSPVVRSKKI